MPIHIIRSPDIIKPLGEILVPKEDVKFLDYKFNGFLWVLGVSCSKDDDGGSVREFLYNEPFELVGQDVQEAYKRELFDHTIEEVLVPPEGSWKTTRPLLGASTLTSIEIVHRSKRQTAQEPMGKAA